MEVVDGAPRWALSPLDVWRAGCRCCGAHNGPRTDARCRDKGAPNTKFRPPQEIACLVVPRAPLQSGSAARVCAGDGAHRVASVGATASCARKRFDGGGPATAQKVGLGLGFSPTSTIIIITSKRYSPSPTQFFSTAHARAAVLVSAVGSLLAVSAEHRPSARRALACAKRLGLRVF